MKNAYDPGRGSGVSLRSALSRGKKQKAAGMGKEGDAERTKEESEKPTPAKKNPRESFFLSPFVAVALFCSPAPSFAFFPCFASLFLFLFLSLSLSLYSLSLSPTPLCVPRRPSRPGRRRAAAPRRQHLVGARDKVGLARRPAGVASAGVGSGGGPVSVGVLAPAAPRGGPAPRLLRRRRRRRRERRGGRGRACGGAAPRRDRRDDVGHRRVRDLRGPPPVAPRRVGPLRHPAVA